MLLSNFRHSRQQDESDCLVACAEMVLTHLGITINYTRLARLLRSGSTFTPFNHLHHLKTLGLFTTIEEQGSLTVFEQAIDTGLPVIVSVQTLAWAHWQGEVTHHAVVVVGIDRANDIIYINDPFFADAPIGMSLLNFQIGWEEKFREYAIIRLSPL